MGKGRPEKYRRYLNALLDHNLYTAYSIARHILSHHPLKEIFPDGRNEKQALTTIRTAMGSYRQKKLPVYGDGFVIQSMGRVDPAWFGWRWKDTPPSKDEFLDVISLARQLSLQEHPCNIAVLSMNRVLRDCLPTDHPFWTEWRGFLQNEGRLKVPNIVAL